MTDTTSQDLTNRELKGFILLNLVLLLITQPGSITYAHFDAPYGFTKDFTTWICSFVGLSPLALVYLVAKRNSISKKAIPAYVAFILILTGITYALQQPLFEGFRPPSYHPNFASFLFGCGVSGILSLVALPAALLQLREVYLENSYDLALGATSLVILVFIILLSRILYASGVRHKAP